MWQFNALGNPQWSEINHPIDDDCNDEALTKLGFEESIAHGSEYVSGMKVYRGPDGQFYAIVNEPSTWIDLMLPNLPSLFEFIRLYGEPYMQMAHTSEIHDLIEELRDLLLDRGHGQFRQMVRECDRNKEASRKRLDRPRP